MIYLKGSKNIVKEIAMSDDTINKVVNLDSIYVFSCIFLLLLINSDRNILDVIYLIVVTIYYVRIKVYRRRS